MLGGMFLNHAERRVYPQSAGKIYSPKGLMICTSLSPTLYHILANISIVKLRLCRSEVMPYGIVKLLLRSREVKCYASYRAKRTSRGVASLHVRRILNVPRKRNT